MTTDRYDVLIVNAETRIVSSVAAYALPLEAEGARPSAAATFTELCPGVRNGFEIAIVTAGQLRSGDTLPEHIVSRKPERPKKMIEGQTYTKNHRTRMADGNCVRCGDQAMDGLLCEPCFKEERTGSAGEGGCQERERHLMRFYVGMDDIAHVRFLPRTFISINRLRRRVSDFPVNEWIMDSGAFTEISTHGRWTTTVEAYATQIERWRHCGRMLAAVAQDLMCEPFITSKTGRTIACHQEETIARYLDLRARTTVEIMPVLQGFAPDDYVRHAEQYGSSLAYGQWTGVGSVCKRNTDPRVIEYILRKIKGARPDLRLHGFGLKLTALKHQPIRALLHSADSMAWSFAARKQGEDAHDWRTAERFVAKIEREQVSMEDFALA